MDTPFFHLDLVSAVKAAENAPAQPAKNYVDDVATEITEVLKA